MVDDKQSRSVGLMAEGSVLLNDAQMKVLRWVKKGCPEGQVHGYSYKATALALQNRKLVKVSKRGGVWQCEITPVGEYFLNHRSYPPGSEPTRIARVGRAVRHPALSVLDQNRTLTDVSKDQKKRALGLLQELCCVLTEEGIAVRGNDHPTWYRARAGSADRALIQADAGHKPVGIDIREHSNRKPHLPSPREAALPHSSAYLIPKYDYEPNGKLYFVLAAGSSVNWDETVRRPMEDRLADIVQAIREYSLNVVRWKQEERDRQDRLTAEWEAVNESAKKQYAEERRAEKLRGQVKEWQDLTELDRFIAAMAARVEAIAPGSDRELADEWLNWVRLHREGRDAFHSLEMPADVAATPDKLAPYMGRLSPYGPPR
jgi:hypothetical protein